MKAAPAGLGMLLNDRSTHVFCPSLQDMTEDLIILIKAVRVPDIKGATTTSNSHLGNKQAPYPETTTGRTNPIRETTVGVKFTQKSHILAIWSQHCGS